MKSMVGRVGKGADCWKDNQPGLDKKQGKGRVLQVLKELQQEVIKLVRCQDTREYCKG